MGQSECKGCSTADPTTDTVKVNVGATLLADADGAGKGSQKQPVVEAQLAEEAERQRRAVEEKRLHEAQERLEREREHERRRLEVLEQQRLEREHAEAQAREQQQRLREQQQRLLEQAALAEHDAAERRKADEAAAARTAEEQKKRSAEEEKARKEAQQKTEAFLRARGFKSIATPQKKCFKASYPLHVAVEENSAEVVRALLQSGADKKAKNSSGKTAFEIAEKLNKKGSHAAVIAALA